MSTNISNEDNIIDSRDVIARIEELEALYDDPDYHPAEYERKELLSLRKLTEQGEMCDDWSYGATLIRESYFTHYTRQSFQDTVSDRKTADRLNQWPFNCINWDRAADELQSDYTQVTFDGVTYWIR